MSKTLNLRLKGIYTTPNNLGTVPDGALTIADNIIIDRDDLAEPRRGIALYGQIGLSPSTDKAKQLITYKQRIIAHYASKLAWDNGSGTFTDFSGTYGEVAANVKIKSVELNGNLYFTTSEGIKKLSVLNASQFGNAGVITQAGGLKALDLEAELYNAEGFLEQDTAVAYRILWGYKDANSNLIAGTPSERVVVSNPANNLLIRDFNRMLAKLDLDLGVSDTDYYNTLALETGTDGQGIYTQMVALCAKLNADPGVTDSDYTAGAATTDIPILQERYNAIVAKLNLDPGVNDTDFDTAVTSQQVKLIITVPSGATTNYFYQVYRSALSNGADVDPGDELQLVFENNPTTTEISDRQIEIVDITPDTFRGADLYTDPSQEGILQSNETPPFAVDVALYKNSVFFANTKTKHRKTINLLGVQNITSSSKLVITDGTNTATYSFAEGIQEETDVTTLPGTTLDGKYFTLSSGRNINQYYVWFNIGVSVDPAPIGLEGIKVDIDVADTDVIVASKILLKLQDYSGDFEVVQAGPVLTILNQEAGPATTATAATSGFTVTLATEGEGENPATGTVQISNLDTVGQQVDETSRSLIRVINRYSQSFINAYYLSGPGDVPGQILFEARTLGTPLYYVLGNDNGIGSSFSPSLTPQRQIATISVANPSIITSTSNHSLSTGDQIVIAGSNSTPSIDGVQTVTVLTPTTFSIPVNVTVAGTAGGFSLVATVESSDNEEIPNRVYYSKNQQPEAVPIVNYIDIGAKDQEIARIIALRDSLFVFKTDGIYRITGETVSSLTTTLFDNTSRIFCYESPAVGNNQIYLYADQGVTTVSDTGVDVISRPIETTLLPLSVMANFPTKAFGCFYETERKYLLFLPSQSSDTTATQAYIYNTFTRAWVRWTISNTVAIVNPVDNKLYLGAGDLNQIEKERKTYTLRDQADRELSNNIVSQVENVVKLDDVSDVDIGDVVSQTQYITAGTFNRLLAKLDTDPGVGENDYLSLLVVDSAIQINDNLIALGIKLDNDPGLVFTNYSSLIGAPTTPLMIQTAFNNVTANLNADPGASFSNYQQSTLAFNVESSIVAVNPDTNEVTLRFNLAYYATAVSIFKSIKTEIQWVPQHAGDPAILKQFRESIAMFTDYSFLGATMEFSSDLKPDFEAIQFEGGSSGQWGLFRWGQTPWGGRAIPKAFRTYVPLQKQRCRFVNPKLRHFNAFEKFALAGLSLVFEVLSPRVQR